MKDYINFVRSKKKFHPKYAKGRTVEVVQIDKKIGSMKQAHVINNHIYIFHIFVCKFLLAID